MTSRAPGLLLLTLLSALLLAGCQPVLDDDDMAIDDDDTSDVVILAVSTEIALGWNLVLWTERVSEVTGEIPTPPDGLVVGQVAGTEVEPGDYRISAEEPSGCFAWLSATGPLEPGDRVDWVITDADVACVGGR